MGFRTEFFTRPHLRERIRHRATAMVLNVVGDRNAHARSADFPRFARELAVRF